MRCLLTRALLLLAASSAAAHPGVGNVSVAVNGAGKVMKVDPTGRVTVVARTRWPRRRAGTCGSVKVAAQVRRIGRDGRGAGRIVRRGG